MNAIDERIRKALQEDAEEKFISAGDDQALMQALFSTLRGRNRWWMALAWVYTLIFFAGAVVSAVLFFRSTDTKELILWAAACCVCMLAVAMLKLWVFMQMDKNSILREIKRLELQVARLASQGAG